MLFDNITRKDRSPRGDTESLYKFINRSSRKFAGIIRSLLEEWFSHYPSEHQKDIQNRFCSEDDLSHRSAFFELYMHKLLLRLDCKVEIHPHVGGVATHPEFLVSTHDKTNFYLECTLAGRSHEDIAKQNIENRVYESLNKLNSPNFFIYINVKGSPKSSPPARKWRNYLEKELSKLDPEEIGNIFKNSSFDGLPSWSTEFDGWQVEFKPIPKSPRKRGTPDIRPIGIRFSGLEWSKTHIHIRNSINEKATKYGDLDFPFIIAINVLDFCCDDLDVMDGLFGKEFTSVSLRQNGSYKCIPGREPNGAWYGPKGPQNTRNSAALIFRNLSWSNIANETPFFWNNPWAKKPFELKFLPLFQKVINKQNGRIETVEGRISRDIFNLPKNWPVHEE